MLEKRLKWHGINSIEEIETKMLNKIYGGNCNCEFDHRRDFKCNCEWRDKITLDEIKSFHALRIVSKPGINSP